MAIFAAIGRSLLPLRAVATLLVAALSALVSAQAPEFTQQYMQRLGGAVDELQLIVDQFDADAAHFGLKRQELLVAYSRAEEAAIRLRGQSMSIAIDRYEALTAQIVALAESKYFLRPLIVVGSIDTGVARRAMENFQPALPLTLAGAFYAGIGFFLILAITRIFTRRPRDKPDQIQPEPDDTNPFEEAFQKSTEPDDDTMPRWHPNSRRRSVARKSLR